VALVTPPGVCGVDGKGYGHGDGGDAEKAKAKRA